MPEASKWQMLAWAAAAALLLVVAVRVLAPAGGHGTPPVRLDGPGVGPGRGSSSRRGRQIYVHVAGAVRRPGLYRVPEGSRVAVALERAGGPTRRAELAAVNLAQPLEDGRQVVVPAAGPAARAPGAGASAAGPVTPGAAVGTPALAGGGTKVSLAVATVEQLDGLDGIGPTLARRILEYREAHGGFRSLEQLREVEGIGEKRFGALKEALQP